MQNIPTNNFLSCALNTYGTLSMFLLSVQTNFYIILSSYIEGHVKQNSSLNFMSFVGFPASEIWTFFLKIYCRASFEIILRQKEFPKTSCFLIFQ